MAPFKFKPQASDSFIESSKIGKQGGAPGDYMTDSTKRRTMEQADTGSKARRQTGVSKKDRKAAKAAKKKKQQEEGGEEEEADAGGESEDQEEPEDDQTAREGEDPWGEEKEDQGGKGKTTLNTGSIVTKGFHKYGATKETEEDWTVEEWKTWHADQQQPQQAWGREKWQQPKGKQKGWAGNGKGKGKGKKGKQNQDGWGKRAEKGKGGDGGKGKGRGPRRRRRTAVGKTPHPLQTKDRNFIYLAQMQTKAILQLQAQVRLLSRVLLTNIIAPIIASPFAKVLESQINFSNALAEYRSEHIEGQPVVGLGAPYLIFFHDVVVALADNNGAGTVHQSINNASMGFGNRCLTRSGYASPSSSHVQSFFHS